MKRALMDKLTDEQKKELEKRAAETSKELDDCDEDTRQRIVNHCLARGVELLSEPPPSSPAKRGDLHELSLPQHELSLPQAEADKIQAVRRALWDRAQEWFKKDAKCIQYFKQEARGDEADGGDSRAAVRAAAVGGGLQERLFRHHDRHLPDDSGVGGWAADVPVGRSA